MCVNEVLSVRVVSSAECVHGHPSAICVPPPSVLAAPWRVVLGLSGPLSCLVHCRLPHRLLETRCPSLGTVRLA